jgi:hypothetical protein
LSPRARGRRGRSTNGTSSSARGSDDDDDDDDDDPSTTSSRDDASFFGEEEWGQGEERDESRQAEIIMTGLATGGTPIIPFGGARTM